MRTLFNPFKEFNYFVEYDIKSNTATLEPYNILLLRGKKDIKKELEEKLLENLNLALLNILRLVTYL